MALRNFRRITNLSNSLRNCSTSAPFVNVAVNDKTGIATITMQKPPVNTLNLEFLNELVDTFQELEKTKTRGVILTSSLKTVFSAGLDINEVYKPEPDRFRQFWSTLHQAWLNMYGSSYPTVAVINGHAPAGGCMLALSCEYRIMVNNFRIGLNEAQLGFSAPKWLERGMRTVIGARQCELALTTANIFKTDEAFKIGLVDEVVQSKEEGIERAHKFLQRYAKIPPLARGTTKKALRESEIQDLLNTGQNEVDERLTIFSSPQVTEGIRLYLQSLKQKKK